MSNDHNDSNSSQFRDGLFDGDRMGRGRSIGNDAMAVAPTSLAQEIAPSSYSSDNISTAIEFRVVRPGGPVRRLRLTGNRYTFGSGEGCSIQLDDETLRPMHAVLLRDAQRILVRAYSVPLEHNGSRVTETSLRLGDIIRMGSYRFELLAAPGIAMADPRTASRAANLGAGLQFAQEASSSLLPQASLPDSSTNHLREKLTDLSQQWHVRHAECDARESRCDDRETQLHSRETELWSRAESMQRRESFLLEQEEAARQIQETFAATTAELETLRRGQATAAESLQEKEQELLQRTHELELRQQELEQSKAEWNQRELEHAEQVAEVSLQLEQTNDHAKSATAAVAKMREEFSALNEQLTELRERHSELQEREVRARSEHERLRNELELARDRAIDLRAASEADRTETEAELTRVSEELEKTISELAAIREESRVSQQTLSDKIAETGRELHDAREQAELARQQAEDARVELDDARENAKAAKEEAARARQASEEARQQADDARAEALEAVAAAESAGSEAHSSEIAELNSRIEQLQVELVDAKQQHQESESDSKAAAAEELEKLRADLTQAEQELADATTRAREAEEAAEGLKGHVTELQESVATANQETSRLKIDYEGANASIRQLELLVDETRSSQSTQHESWADESEQLRKSVEELSLQLSQAHAELEALRDSNQALSDQLAVASETSDADQGPSPDQWDELQDELNASKLEIEKLQQSHEGTVQRIQSEHLESEETLRDEIQQLKSHVSDLETSVAQVEPQSPVAEEMPATSVATSVATPAATDEETPNADWSSASQVIGGALGIGAAALGVSALGDAVTTEQDNGQDSDPVNENSPLEEAVSSHDAQKLYDGQDLYVAPNYEAELEGQHLDIDGMGNEVEAAEAEAAHEEAAEVEAANEQQYAQDGSGDLSPSRDGLPENIVESGESVWRMEVEQSSPVEAPAASDWSDVDSRDQELGHEFSDDSSADLAKSDWSQADYMAASAIDPAESGLLPADSVPFDPEADSSESLSWEVEPPEHAVADAIADIEHNVEQAISNEMHADQMVSDSSDAEQFDSGTHEYQSEVGEFTEPEQATGPSLDEPSGLGEANDAPQGSLDWSQYLPGGDDGGSAEAETPIEQAPIEQAPIEQAPIEQDPIEQYAELSREMQPSAEDETPSYHGSESEFEEPEESGQVEFADEDVSQSTGALAEMLIRDLSARMQDTTGEDALAHDEPAYDELGDQAEQSPSTLHLAEEDISFGSHDSGAINDGTSEDGLNEIENTFVMDQATSGASDSDSQAWNMEPSGYASDDAYAPTNEHDYPADQEPTLTEDTQGSFEQPLVQASVDASASEVAPATVSTPDPEDDSIEAYMSRLLQRAQGDEAPAIQATETPPAAPVEESVTSSSVEAVTEHAVEPEPIEQPRDDSPMVPRSKAPERDRNMSAMRELANQSARNAVSRSIRIQARDTQLKASYKASFALAFAMMGLGVFLFVDWASSIKMVMMGAFAVLVFVFGHEAWGLWSEAQRRLSLAEENSDGTKDDQEIAREMAMIAEEADAS